MKKLSKQKITRLTLIQNNAEKIEKKYLRIVINNSDIFGLGKAVEAIIKLFTIQ